MKRIIPVTTALAVLLTVTLTAGLASACSGPAPRTTTAEAKAGSCDVKATTAEAKAGSCDVKATTAEAKAGSCHTKTVETKVAAKNQ